MGASATFARPLRQERPRLFQAPGDVACDFPPPDDPVRQRILANILASCSELAGKEPVAAIPLCPHSPHPFHQLYITFYMGMEATALIEQYSFAWRMTGERRWLERARCWLDAATAWEHSDRVEEHFYTANRYMQALAVALDWLAGALTATEEQRIEACLVQLLERWWPEVDAGRHSPEGGHHAVVDNGHFGVAALQLLGRQERAAEWVAAVVDRFRAGIMPHGCGEDGSPVDGPSFWGPENNWMLQFGDALRHLTGVDLYREFPERLRRPLLYIRYNLVVPADTAAYAAGGGAVNPLATQGLSAALLRLAQEAGDAAWREVALSDPDLGRIYRYGVGVLGSEAECMVAMGPYAYLWYDPDFRPEPRDVLPWSRTFSARTGESVVLRSGWDRRALVAQVAGYGGAVAHSFANLSLYWAGHPVLTSISAFEASPVSCGNLPCVGGQNEHIARVGALVRGTAADRVRLESPRTWHEYWMLHGPVPALVLAVRRKPRQVEVVRENGESLARLNGLDCLQYPREPHFNPEAGELRLRFRLAAAVDDTRRQLLFHTGTGLPSWQGRTGGSQVNSFFLGFMGTGKGLTFGVQSQRYLVVQVSIPPDVARVTPGRWHEITARWGGFNIPAANPFIELELDGCRRRFDNPDTFGEVGKDTQNLARQEPRPFYVHPNTVLAFGAAAQLPDGGIAADLAMIGLDCPGRTPLRIDFSDGLAGETGSGELVFKMNPTSLLELEPGRAGLGAGPERVALHRLLPDAVFQRQPVPFYPSGLAASSRKSFREEDESDAVRLLASCGTGERLILLFAPAAGAVRVDPSDGGFELTLDGHRYAFEFEPDSGGVLQFVSPS